MNFFDIFSIIIASIFLILLIVTLIVVICMFICAVFNINMTRLIIKKEKKKLRKKQKNKKQQLEKQLRETGIVGSEALKFEYNNIYTIVNQEIAKLEKLESAEYQISELYLLRLHIYYKDLLKIRTFERNSVEFLACVYRAINDEPVFIDEKGNDIFYINNKLKINVIKAFKKLYQNIYFDDKLVKKQNLNELYDKCLFDPNIYDNPNLIWSKFIIEILLRE